MKKIFVSLTMLALIFAAVLSGTAFAQTETATVVNWEDVYPSVEESGISGTFYNVGDSGLCMWIPDGIFYEEKLTDEEVESGYMAYLTTDNNSAVISVTYAVIEGMDVPGLYDLLAETEGVEELEFVVINGIAAVTYKMPEQDSMTVSFVDDDSYIYEFTFSPASDEGFQQFAAIMGASIQTVD